MGKEIELKLDLASGGAELVRADALLAGVEPTERYQLSVYFDTPKGALAAKGCSLRLRFADGGAVQTFKRTSEGASLFARDEWEWRVEGDRPDVARLAELPDELGGWLQKQSSKLRPVLRSEVGRTSWRLRSGGSSIQVDLDVGALATGERELALEEVEFELLEGEATEVFALAAEMASRVPARLGVLSKAERGAALLARTIGRVVKAAPLDLASSMTVADAFAAVIRACLKHFRLNEELVLSDRHPDALHQLRVAMRRLRSALTFFRPAIRGDAAYAQLREELRWYTAQLGDARNLDVFLQRDLLAKERVAAGRRREQAYSKVVDTFESARARLLLLKLTGWIETGDWRKDKIARRPVPDFAGKRLDRLWATIDPAGRSLSRMSEAGRHELRIQVKKMRYAIEFFDALYPVSKRKTRFLEAIEAFQEALGKLNDLTTARDLADGQDDEWWREQAEELTHLRDAETAQQRMGKAGPFWRFDQY